jgi:DNA processing protein
VTFPRPDVPAKLALGQVMELRPDEPGYPRLLAMSASPPSPLFVAGEILPEDALAVAVVGSRQPTPYGLAVAERFGRELAGRGVTVVSGLARGIDSAAHEGALAAGGRTIAVLGCGLGVDYPPNSRPLKERVVRSGALVSELPSGAAPQTFTFPRRNRIISGLSLGVVVVEAGEKSGALITAGWAADQGREVMAVPGRVDSPLSAGTFSLLRQGATPVSDAGEILEAVGAPALFSMARPDGGRKAEKRGLRLPDALAPILSLVERGPARADEIAAAAGREIPRVLAELSRLELEGLVRKGPGGYYSLPNSPGRNA